MWGRRLWANYRLTREGYNELLALQGGGCALCGEPQGEGRRRLGVDHDHSCCPELPTCGQCTRGLLCAFCNWLLAKFGDSPDAFRRIAEYLEVDNAF